MDLENLRKKVEDALTAIEGGSVTLRAGDPTIPGDFISLNWAGIIGLIFPEPDHFRIRVYAHWGPGATLNVEKEEDIPQKVVELLLGYVKGPLPPGAVWEQC